MGMSRVLNLGLSNWVMSDFEVKEEEQHEKVHAAVT